MLIGKSVQLAYVDQSRDALNPENNVWQEVSGGRDMIIDTGNTFLYFVLNDRQAMRYGIGVGREGFTWSGEQAVARKAEWPDWHPPSEMVSRQPYLPRFMAGGPGNPLGARAMYLGETEYRIHGTNKPDTIGKRVSSGCIRLTNDDVVDLYERVKVGAKVIVLPATAARRPSQALPDAALRSPDPTLPSNRPSTTSAQMLSSGPKIAEVKVRRGGLAQRNPPSNLGASAGYATLTRPTGCREIRRHTPVCPSATVSQACQGVGPIGLA